VKKIVVFLLLISYTFSAIGATMHLHFCMDKFVGTNLFHHKNEACGKCGMKEEATKKGCCKDEEQKIKITDEHQKSITENYIGFVFNFIYSQPIYISFILHTFSTTLISTTFHPPPDIAYQSFQVLYGTFLI
jgi:hypothetical protein